MPGDSSFFKKVFNKTETFTATDLQKADTEYVEAANALNAVDFGAENFDEQRAAQIKSRFDTARDNYKKIHRAIHPEAYTGENANATILPDTEHNS